jgi:hypothetical protein
MAIATCPARRVGDTDGPIEPLADLPQKTRDDAMSTASRAGVDASALARVLEVLERR